MVVPYWWRWRFVAVDVKLQRRCVADEGSGDAGHAAPVDDADRHVHQEVERNRVLPVAR